MKSVDGMLVLYHHERYDYAPTVMDHVRSFANTTTLPIWLLNTGDGFPPSLSDLSFRVIVIHYSLSGSWPHLTAWKPDDRVAFHRYVRDADAHKIAFFQDEHLDCQQRFQFIRESGVDCIFSLLEPAEVPKVYGRYTPGVAVRHTLTGYVPPGLIEKARMWSKPRAKRSIDVGYRGRPLPYYNGRAAREKTNIADEFVRRVSGNGLNLDVKTAEEDRIYGNDWYRFVANCRAMLGVEAGVSIFDLEGNAQRECDAYLARHPYASFEEVHAAVLRPFEDNIYYRTISPRVFEAAAFRTCQILFEGHYNGILEPMRHYIPLKKDFSNLDEVLVKMADDKLVDCITERAYEDLIASGKFSYEALTGEIDDYLLHTVGAHSMSVPAIRAVDRALALGRRRRFLRRRLGDFRNKIWNRLHQPFPGKRFLKPIFGPLAIWLFVPESRKRN